MVHKAVVSEIDRGGVAFVQCSESVYAERGELPHIGQRGVA